VKLGTFRVDGERRVGRLDAAEGHVRPFALERAAAERGVEALARLVAEGLPLPELGDPVALSDIELEAPIPRPRRNIFCVGKNYHDHAQEFASSGFDSSAAAGAVPKVPIIFSKVPESVIAAGQPIRMDSSVDPAVDYEVELAVIIGKGGRGITKAEALDHVWGYTIVNDVTARDLQGRHSQWLIGKSQDTFCPMGPWAVTADEIDLANTPVLTFVNGEKRQDSNTGLLIFDVPTLIETLSAGITLLPGDVIATGTPAGVGIGFKPPRYLSHGDAVRCEIGGIGALENRIVDRAREAQAAD
jgi:2-keto-4-pentenoate hydratase/2-oxohepta-3-ene-1,7-dioic acid hydratase in catechol pathway